MTPNPNPSPEFREGVGVRFENGDTGVIVRLEYVVQLDEPDGTQGLMGGSVGVWTGESDHFAALSPQTLPAPGEVERPDASRADGVGQDELVAGLKRALQHPAGDHDGWTDAGMEHAFFRWPVIVNALNEALATVAAANDEGVNFRALLIEAGRNAGALLDDRVSDTFLKGIPEEVRLKIERLREDTRTIQRNTATYRQEARAEADAAIERAAEANMRADNMAEANRRLLAMFEADPTSLATSRSQHEGAE